MKKEPSHNAFKRVAATLLDMGLTRLELAGLELSQAKSKTIEIIALGFSMVLVLALGSVFVCLAIAAYYWDTYRVASLCACAGFYAIIAIGCGLKLRYLTNDSTPIFEATSAELLRDKEAILRSISDD
jgi:uncharacterized membrane protein YqjE